MKNLLFPAFLVLMLAGCAGAAEPTATTDQSGIDDAILPDLSPDEMALGEAIYNSNCAACHGENLEGEADWKQQNEDGSFRSPPHTADGHTWHHADSVLIEAIREGGARFESVNIGGTSKMPPFSGTLTDEEILAVLTFIKSTWPDDVRTFQWQQTIQDSSS